MNLSQNELISQLRQIDEYEFEKLVADVWEERGWKTTVTTGSNDRGIDVIAEKATPFSQKHLIQAKRYSADNTIGSPDIQQYSSLRHQEDDVDAVVVVTTSSFSSQARQTANDLNVKLIDGEKLSQIILNLNSQRFLSDYFSKEAHTTGEVEKSRQKTDTTEKDSNTTSSKTGKSNSTDKPHSTVRNSKIPNEFDKKEKTDKFTSYCPMCGKNRSIWEGKTADTDPMLVCEQCGTQWRKKTGLIAKTKWIAIGEDMKKTVKGWKEKAKSKKSSLKPIKSDKFRGIE